MDSIRFQEDERIYYAIAVLDRDQLLHYVSATEVDRLADEDLQEIAVIMQKELQELGFWEHVAFVVRCKLAEKEDGNSKESM